LDPADPSAVTIAERLEVAPGEASATDRATTWTSPITLTGLVVVALLVTWFPHAFGGRDSGATSVAAIAVAVSLVLIRRWRSTRLVLIGLLAWLAVAALLVVPLTSGGRGAAVAATTYGLAAGAFLLTRRLGRDELARQALVAAIALGGILQFGWAFLPWWGSGDPAHGMVGTYYWKNQYAAALLAPAVLGLALAVLNRRPWRTIGWVAAPLAVTGTFLSASRAALAVLVLGWVVVGPLLVAGGDRRGRAVRWVAVSLLTAVVAVVLPGPPLFMHRQSPLSQTVATTADGHLQSSGDYRVQVWTEAVHVFANHPVNGVGYGRVAAATDGWRPADWPASALVHNGGLQALADGGLLLGVPFLLLLGAAVVALLRAAIPRSGARRGPMVEVAAVAGLMLIAHSMVDFDWSYPALAVIAAVVIGLAVPAGPGTPEGLARRSAGWLGAVLVAALVIGGIASWGQQFHVNASGAVTNQGDSK
jgi:O-antigen ligase